jgi:phenylalanyl-tRNA synthetase beta chain
LVVTGGVTEEDRAQVARETDFYDLKGSLEAAIAVLNRPPLRFADGPAKHLREGQRASIMLANGSRIGSLGRLCETVANAYKFRQPIYVAELDLTSLLVSEEIAVHYEPLPRYPSVVRDVTILVDRRVTLEDLLGAVARQGVADCRRAQLVGTYEGTNIPEGKRAVTLRVEYRSEERTLRDDEVEERQRSLIDSLLSQFSAQLH